MSDASIDLVNRVIEEIQNRRKPHQHYQATVRALANGQPRPSAPPGIADEVEAACRAKLSK